MSYAHVVLMINVFPINFNAMIYKSNVKKSFVPLLNARLILLVILLANITSSISIFMTLLFWLFSGQ